MKNKFRDPILWAILLMIWSITCAGIFGDCGYKGISLSSSIIAAICFVYILVEGDNNGLYKS